MIFIRALKSDEESGHGLDLDSLTPSRTNHVFHILEEKWASCKEEEASSV